MSAKEKLIELYKNNPLLKEINLTEELAKYGVAFYSISITDMDAGEAIEAAITNEAVAKKAVETNTYIELNASKMLFTKKELLMMVRLGVKFVINTDAHKPQKVGVAENVIKTLEEYGVPLDSVANLNGVPKFKRVKR